MKTVTTESAGSPVAFTTTSSMRVPFAPAVQMVVIVPVPSRAVFAVETLPIANLGTSPKIGEVLAALRQDYPNAK
jgi:hypothetical protein